ncbi:MAG TPA: hypothetical protein VKO45_09710 [Methanomicrobiales archaeon]|nr:hypothetical protein [Methanomicrobiales archaeon]
MPGKDKKKGIICHSPVDFERIFLPRSFERKEKEKILKEPGGFGKNLEKELIASIRKGRGPRTKGKK